MRKKLTIAVFAAMLMLMSSNAYAFDLGDYIGGIMIKFLGYSNGPTYEMGNYEFHQETGAPGNGIEDSWGAGLVESIRKVDENGVVDMTSSGKLWTSGGSEELAFFYRGVDDWKVAMSSPTQGQIWSVGGVFELYSLTTPIDWNAAERSSTEVYDSITSGEKLARFNLTPGVDATDPISTMIDQVDIKLVGDGQQVFGSGSSLANVDLGGDWNTSFANSINSDVFNGSDLSLGYTIAYNPNYENDGFQFLVNDPAYAKITPEPISSALFLLGSGALAIKVYRKKRKSA